MCVCVCVCVHKDTFYQQHVFFYLRRKMTLEMPNTNFIYD